MQIDLTKLLDSLINVFIKAMKWLKKSCLYKNAGFNVAAGKTQQRKTCQLARYFFPQDINSLNDYHMFNLHKE